MSYGVSNLFTIFNKLYGQPTDTNVLYEYVTNKSRYYEHIEICSLGYRVADTRNTWKPMQFKCLLEILTIVRTIELREKYGYTGEQLYITICHNLEDDNQRINLCLFKVCVKIITISVYFLWIYELFHV
jgi:hypothetical protein